jgi:hypothetical protein
VSPVDIDFAAIFRRLADDHDDDVYVELLLDGDDAVSAGSLDAARAARASADAVVKPGSVGTQGPWPGPNGPVILLDAGDAADRTAWLTPYAAALEAAGWHGRLSTWTQEWLPRAFGRSTNSLITGFVALELRERFEVMAPRWSVDSSVTRAFLADAVEWAGHDDAAAYVALGRLSLRRDRDDAGVLLAEGIELAGFAGVTYVDEAGGRAGRCFASSVGSVVLQRDDSAVQPVDGARAMRELLLRHAEHLDLAFLRVHSGWVHGWVDLDSAQPTLAHIEEYHLRLNRDLWSSYVPDAHGIQVLTDAHLERAADLSSWEVVELPAGRHLVQARDLAPWFEPGPPPPEVLAVARREFGDMLLTPDHIARHRG